MATNFSTLNGRVVGVCLSASLLVGVPANRFIHHVQASLIGGGAPGTALNAAT